MTATRFAFSQALLPLGDAEMLIGNPKIAGGMRSIAATEGPASENITWKKNVLTAPQNTGGIPHQATVVVDDFTVTFPVLAGDPNLWSLIEPHGKAFGVQDTPYAVVETSMLLIPHLEFDATLGLSHVVESGTSTVTNLTGGAATAPTPKTVPPNSAGNATWASAASTAGVVRQTITLTFLTATTASVVGQALGAMGTLTLGTPFVSSPAGFNITGTAGATPQVAGDVFYWRINPLTGGWSPAAPINTLFFPRCFISHDAIGRPYDNLGKSIVPLTVTPMYDVTAPAGKRVWCRGDMVAEGFSGILI
jgi:hypothetical protein